MKIHITSDTHLDFWIDVTNPQAKQIKMMNQLINYAMPEEKCDILLIAGDIGHYNWQNEMFFKELKKYYKHILWVFGNHDLYMVSKNVLKDFNANSWNRLDDMIERSNNIEGVHYLSGNILEIDGYKFGGHGMWYDGTYSLRHFQMNHIEQMKYWQDFMNDSNLINVPDTPNGLIDWYTLSKEAIEDVRDIVKECDVFMSHVGPDCSRVLSKWHNAGTGFYYFDGEELLCEMNENQAWIYGHTHDPAFFKNVYGCNMICNPLGYPYGNTTGNLNEAEKRKFLVYEVGSKTDYDEIFKEIDNG